MGGGCRESLSLLYYIIISFFFIDSILYGSSHVGTHVFRECAALSSTIPTPIHLTAVGTLSRVG